MVGVVIIAVVFSGLAGGIWWGASRGGFGNVSNVVMSESPTGRRLFSLTMVIVYVGFGIAVPLIFILGNHAKASAQVGGVKLTAVEKQGRLLFGEHCAVCHTLAAAAAVGKVGPDLDQLQPSVAVVERTIANGCLQAPGTQSNESCLGYGNMPADVVQGRDAQDVAEFVATVAGH
jgi:mono/diheme cytochrome c family protein